MFEAGDFKLQFSGLMRRGLCLYRCRRSGLGPRGRRLRWTVGFRKQKREGWWCNIQDWI